MKKDKSFYEKIASVKDEIIVDYLKNELQMSDELIDEQIKSFQQNQDIYDEFKYAFYQYKTENIPTNASYFELDEPVTEQGFSALDLFKKFGHKLLFIGIFNLLISLREDPAETNDYINRGLPRH